VRFLLPLALLTVVVVGLVLLRRGASGIPPLPPAPPPAPNVAEQEHQLGIRPCSLPDCADCQVWAARHRPDRQWWQPADAGTPRTVRGRIVAIDATSRGGRQAPVVYLDPVDAATSAWQIEAGDPALAAALARFRVGDVVTITAAGPDGPATARGG
jgi:hypothetical protein